MKSQRSVRLEGVCAHFALAFPALRVVRDGVDVDFVGVSSGSGNSFGCERVETILDTWAG